MTIGWTVDNVDNAPTDPPPPIGTLAPDGLSTGSFRSRSRVWAAGLGALCFAGCGPSGSSPGPTPTSGPGPSLVGAYRFQIPESTETSSITVVFSGQLNPGTGTTPDTKFSITQMAPVARGPGIGFVSFSTPPGLKPGTWTITATPNGFGAPAKCESVTVPGHVTLSVIQGEPRCGR